MRPGPSPNRDSISLDSLLVIGAQQANHVSDGTCDLIQNLFAYYIWHISLYNYCIYAYIYCDVLGFVQWESDHDEITIVRLIHL